MIVDSHQHFWTLARGDYAWPNDSVAPIFRDFAPSDLKPRLDAAGVARTVLVQATDSTAETRFLLDLAAHHDWIAGVVGWVDLAAPDAIAVIDDLRRDPNLRGLRPMLQSIDDTDWICREDVAPALRHMADCGLCFDALIQPRHLGALDRVAAAHPDLSIVIDHMAKPAMGHRRAPDPDWSAGMTALAGCENVCCKLSGLVTEAGTGWHPDDLRPFVEVVLTAFGPHRVLWGSDWPVLRLASDYATWLDTTSALIAALDAAAQRAIMGGNATRFYKL